MTLDAGTVIFFSVLVVAVILHEISHGVAANAFGDPTARDAGRLTLNPIPHIDPFGSVILPAMGALTGIPVIGWAKPVPVNPNRLRNPRTQMFFVSFAGPISNLLLAAIGVGVARLFVGDLFEVQRLALEFQPGSIFDFSETSLPFAIAYSFALVNVFLAAFNLLPIPPLDGSAVFELVMPAHWRPNWYRFRPYGILVLFGLLWFGGGAVLSWLLDPFVRVVNTLIVA